MIQQWSNLAKDSSLFLESTAIEANSYTIKETVVEAWPVHKEISMKDNGSRAKKTEEENTVIKQLS